MDKMLHMQYTLFFFVCMSILWSEGISVSKGGNFGFSGRALRITLFTGNTNSYGSAPSSGDLGQPGSINGNSIQSQSQTSSPVTGTPSTTSQGVANPSSAAGNTGNTYMNTILQFHNERRSQHHVGPLAWSSDAANAAQAWANTCTEEDQQGAEYGENMAYGFSDTTGAMTAWYNEGNLYNYNDPTATSFEEIGHFTQMVWKGTTQVGCATQSCNGQTQLFFCFYLPPGNVEGEFTQNVLPIA